MSGYNDYDDEGHAEGGEMENPDSAMSILALYATTPNSMKSLRACKRCGMIRTHLQFHEEGCPNCPFLEMAEDQKATNEYTTVFFEGTCAVTDPRSSWAARWLHVDGMHPGVYAITVMGSFSPDLEDELTSRGLRW
eukprot:CAMPEP_0113304692 /NCGR_PEP_ID=MMETSP0010_2-20120614/4609_1 /TAXON_ID=216773 ORGANISM="Corethron hystrix, Strain 308" /NCGR_SAMPLE_ID=MMETSP0010_2 /ASSEMBLY_ACC=CAM_ASM_000155 /LENGTH=135 /DNA_ID=CAMNT_0000158945 /DNA_START=96 /DNA_END=500 /DNA_ORIENTATION=+ /assembly_acc=CAM_ASM_000155